MAEITYKVEKQIGVINDSGAWETQVNLISWNHAKPKYDIRKWNVENGKMSKGISLTEDEMLALRDLLNEYFDSEPESDEDEEEE